MNSVEINFSDQPPIKLIIIDPKKFKSRFRTTSAGRGRAQRRQHHHYSAFESPQSQQRHHLVVSSEEASTSSSAVDPPTKCLSSPSTDLCHSAQHLPSSALAQERVERQSLLEEAEAEEETNNDEHLFLSTQQTTRLGRVSKIPQLFSLSGSSSGSSTSSHAPQPQKRRRAPAEAFRWCKTCSKYYVGHTKLKLHYKKNPDHVVQPPPSTASTASTAPATSKSSIGVQCSSSSELKTDLLGGQQVQMNPIKPIFLDQETTPHNCENKVRIDESPQSASAGAASQTSAGSQYSQTKSSKSIWEAVEEKLAREGINQLLIEMTDVAERLSKLARDRMIPVREEEQSEDEQAGLVQVDNPFLSHLLDLPFGTYVLREEEEEDDRAPRALKPITSELSQFSLTSGAEVDIDKFLTGPADDSLPHLTNIDFSAICNGGSESGGGRDE